MEEAFTYTETVWLPTITVLVSPNGVVTASIDGFVNAGLTLRREN